MPRPSKGARPYLQSERRDADGRITQAAVWLIRDGKHKHSTGIFGADAATASDPRVQAALRDYLAQRHDPAPGERHPSQIPVADVLNLYSRDVLPNVAMLADTKNRILRLADWWGDKMLSDVRGASCRAYAEHRGKPAMARRELEDLRAAIRHHWREGYCSEETKVVLPPRSVPRERWLTRGEAARLIWAAWRYREVQKGVPTRKRSRRHIARFILVALYTGSRAGVICAAATAPKDGHGFIDYERGVFYRKPAGSRRSKKRAPPIRIPDRLMAHLRRWRRVTVGNRRISEDFVIEWNGAPVASIRRALSRVVADAGLSKVSAHAFRHTTATWGMQNGADPWKLAGLLGMTVEQLERTYGHHSPTFQKGAGDAITKRPGQKHGRNDENGNATNASQEAEKRVISMRRN